MSRPILSFGNILLIISLVLLCSSCIETIDFDVERSGSRLVVDGMITDTPGPHTLKLRRTTDEETTSKPLSGALITITDNLGNSESYYEIFDGTYILEGSSVKGVQGRSYSIEITLPNGYTYRSEEETMPTEVAKDSIHYEFDTITELNEYGSSSEKEIVRIIRHTTIPETEQPLYLKWEIEETYKFSEYDFPDPFGRPPPMCYITRYPEPQTIHLLNGRELASGKLAPQTILERNIDYTFYQRHYINLIQYSVTRQAHEYWTEVDQIVNQSGTIFDVPPANAHSNIKNVNDSAEQVFGYFSAAAVDTSRVFLVRAYLPIHISNPCNRQNGPDCVGGCTSIDNSSPQPPYYWLQD